MSGAAHATARALDHGRTLDLNTCSFFWPVAPAVYHQLVVELDALARSVEADNVFVFDAWAVIWCAASNFPLLDQQERLFTQVEQLLRGLATPLHRGGKLTGWFDTSGRTGKTHCESFGGVYVLMVWTTEVTTDIRRTASLSSSQARARGP